MRLRVTVEGKSYDVEVEVIDPFALGSAASRVEGSPVGSVPRPAPSPTRLGGNAGSGSSPPTSPLASARAAAISNDSIAGGATTIAPALATPGAPKPPAPILPPWHGLSVGAAGVVAAPAPGAITRVFVKVGDALRAADPIVEFQMSSVVAPQERAAVGTIRAVQGGIVADVMVAPGATVAFGQALARLAPRER
jgi:biotin carboxyl carrier protein